MIGTKTKILDSAERIWAERGYASTSLRSIMADAQVNVASIHYYFRSKQALLEAVIERRMEPANEERMRRLAEYEREPGHARLEVERILEIFLRPAFEMAADPARGGYTFVRLLGRLQAESDLLPQMVFARFGPVLLHFADALARALPDLTAADLFWRARLAMGATAQILRDAPHIKSLGQIETNDWHAVMRRIIPFLAAGFRAPLPFPAVRVASSSTDSVKEEIWDRATY